MQEKTHAWNVTLFHLRFYGSAIEWKKQKKKQKARNRSDFNFFGEKCSMNCVKRHVQFHISKIVPKWHGTNSSATTNIFRDRLNNNMTFKTSKKTSRNELSFYGWFNFISLYFLFILLHIFCSFNFDEKSHHWNVLIVGGFGVNQAAQWFCVHLDEKYYIFMGFSIVKSECGHPFARCFWMKYQNYDFYLNYSLDENQPLNQLP